MLSQFYVVVIFMMQRLGGTVQPCTNEDDDHLLERVIVGGESIRESCSSSHTDIHSEILVSSEYSIRQLVCHVMDKKQLIPTQLDHDRELEVFRVDPKDIKDFIFGHEWLDIRIQQLWCM